MRIDGATALLVIDMQQGFLDPLWGERNNPALENNVAALLDSFREAALPIVHIRHDSVSAQGHFHPGKPGNDALPDAQALADEPVHRKNVNSAFIGTSLERDLRSRGIRQLVVVGLTTNHCVSTTVRMSANLGFDTAVVADATAAFEGISIDGDRRPAEEVHATALSDLQEEFASIVDTASVIQAIERAPVAALHAAE